MNALNLRWKPPGPVAKAYFLSSASPAVIMGPVGSGKTSTTMLKGLKLASQQAPSTVDGIRKTRVTFIHRTYRQLWRAVIPSWWRWMPKDSGDWSGGKDEPARHELRFDLADGTMAHLLVDFIAIGDNAVEEVLRGYEPTVFALMEADLLAWDVFSYCRTRTGRYPVMAEGGPTWHGILADTNAFDVESEMYANFVESLAPGSAFFRQPSGLSPDAENLENLPPGYYENMARGMDEWMRRKYIENEFTFSRDGKPVYPEYNDRLHCAERELEPVKGLPLRLGLDAGLTPAAVVGQRMPNGQWRWLDELAFAAGAGVGPTRFSRYLNMLLEERYPQFPKAEIVATADPSSAFGADSEEGELPWIDVVSRKTGIRIRPARSNVLNVRLDAVRGRLEDNIDGRHPGLLISPRCRVIRRGFNATYRYKKVLGADGRHADKPDKNDASHPHDAGQYLMLQLEYEEAMGRQRHLETPASKQRFASSDEDWGSGGFALGD